MIELTKLWKDVKIVQTQPAIEIRTDPEKLKLRNQFKFYTDPTYLCILHNEDDYQVVALYKKDNFDVLWFKSDDVLYQQISTDKIIKGWQKFFCAQPSAKQIMQALNVYGIKHGRVLQRVPIKSFVNSLDEINIANAFKHKAGVLLQRAGQKTEEEFFNNDEGDKFYQQFLNCLGNVVNLQDFDQYNGGLDLKGRDCQQSHFCDKDNHQLMYHIGTLLRQVPNDAQQVGKKKHIGNDNVIVVFQEDKDSVFQSNSIKSSMIYIIIVVQNLATEHNEDTVNYKVNICAKSFVDTNMIQLGKEVTDGLEMSKQEFSNFFFKLVVKCIEECWRSGDLKMKLDRLKQLKLNEWVKQFE